MIYRFIDNHGTFRIDDPQKHCLYLPLTDASGRLLSAVSPNLAGDIKRDNSHFLTVPASIEDVRSNLLCRREFFLRVNGKNFRLSEPRGDSMEGGFLYQKLFKRCAGLKVEILNFVPHDNPVEVMRVRVANTGRKMAHVGGLSFIPLFGRAEKCLRDHRHVSSLLNRVYLRRDGIILRPSMVFDEKGHRENNVNYFVFACDGQGRPPQGQFPTLDSFLGSGDILRPEAPEKNLPGHTRKLPEFDGKEACAAFRFAERRLKPGQSVDYCLVLGIADREAEALAMFRRLDRGNKIEKSLEATKDYWQSYLSGLAFDFKDNDFNGWLAWVTLQPALRKLFGCSFLPHFDYGKGGRGWRDLWQDALALLLTEPEKAGEIISRSFRGVRVDGSNATIITTEGDFIGDRNRINRVWMDHGVWPYLTTRLYINRTGDPRFLLSGQTYFRDHQLMRARRSEPGFSQRDFLLRDAKGKVCRGSILEHILVQNLVQFFNVGRHNIIRLENADWNDGLDMAADKGESVVFSFMYAHNLRDLTVYLEKLKETADSVPLMKELVTLLDRFSGTPVDYGDYRQKQLCLERYFRQTMSLSGEKVNVPLDGLISDLKQKWEHASSWLGRREWLPEGFFNGYYDNQGRRVEGTFRKKARMTLPPQVFALMSGVATGEQANRIWKSLRRHLMDRRHRGFRLNTDFGSIQMDLGRAFGFSYGDKENGAFFNHMVVMLANALYSRGLADRGRQVLDSIRSMAMADSGQVTPVLPEYFNSAGRGLYLYLTGSASWYVYTLTQEVLGIKFFFGDLLIAPRLFPEDLRKGSIEARISLDRNKLYIKYSRASRAPAKSGKPLGLVKAVINGKETAAGGGSCLIRRSSLNDGMNRIEIILE